MKSNIRKKNSKVKLNSYFVPIFFNKINEKNTKISRQRDQRIKWD